MWLLLSFLLLAAPALAEWREIGAVLGPDRFLVYVDPEFLPAEHRIVVAVTHLQNYQHSRADPATGLVSRSVTIRAEYDCHREQARFLETTMHAGAMGTEAIVATEPGEGRWVPLIPGSVGAMVWQAACR